MNDQDLNNFFKPAKEMIKKLPKQSPNFNKSNTSQELKRTILINMVLSNSTKNLPPLTFPARMKNAIERLSLETTMVASGSFKSVPGVGLCLVGAVISVG